jgi:hypothetical protein
VRSGPAGGRADPLPASHSSSDIRISPNPRVPKTTTRMTLLKISAAPKRQGR